MSVFVINKLICCLLQGFEARQKNHPSLLLALGLLLVVSSASAQMSNRDSLRLAGKGTPEIRQMVPAVLGLSMTAFLVDESINDFVSNHQSGFLDQLSELTDAAGEKTIVVPAVVLTYGVARFAFQNERLEATSLKAMQSVVVTALATEGLKHLAGRSRPFNDQGAYVFEPFPGGSDQYKSLPSGHASLAFALFTPFAEEYSRWIYIVPVSVAAGRLSLIHI